MSENINVDITDRAIAASCLCTKLRATSRKVSRTYDNALRPVGLKANQFSILVAISLLGPISITDLSEKLAMERTTLTRNLRPLEKKGIVHIKDGYGRTRELTLTMKGTELLHEARPLWNSVQTNLVKELGEGDTEMVSRLLNQILNIDVIT